MKVLAVVSQPPSIRFLVYGQEKTLAGGSLDLLINAIARNYADPFTTKADIREDVNQVIQEQLSNEIHIPHHLS